MSVLEFFGKCFECGQRTDDLVAVPRGGRFHVYICREPFGCYKRICDGGV